MGNWHVGTSYDGKMQGYLCHHRTMTLTPSFIPSLSTSHFNYRHDRRGIHHVLGVGNGLTDDGDFAILGINVSLDDNDDDEDEEKINLNKYILKDEFNTGTLIGSGGVGNMLFNEHLQRSGRVDLGVGATNKYRDFRGNGIVKKDGDPIVKEWLMELLFNLDIYDVERGAADRGGSRGHGRG